MCFVASPFSLFCGIPVLGGHLDAAVDARDQLSRAPPPLRTIKAGGFFDHDRLSAMEASTKALVMILAGTKSNHSSVDT